jgi:hypothetical protein
MTAPERFADSQILLHRGRRPYMTHSGLSRPLIDALREARRTRDLFEANRGIFRMATRQLCYELSRYAAYVPFVLMILG